MAVEKCSHSTETVKHTAHSHEILYFKECSGNFYDSKVSVDVTHSFERDSLVAMVSGKHLVDSSECRAYGIKVGEKSHFFAACT